MATTKKICDSCGKPYTGKSYPIVDENYRKQRGLKQCGRCYELEIINGDKELLKEFHEQQLKKIGNQRSPFGIGS